MRRTKRRTEGGTQSYSLTLNPASIKEMDKIASDLGRSRSELVDEAIKEYLLKSKQKEGPISVVT